eukprot:TRINITY_DN1812_c0_g2_i2.p1 TRINITY_DN1812_c0_g2~~TRINITY_DN1812_c0_g2_i2.p1  ORF type:complete len:370 (+),score=103.39 TRINITY_DN1812_c0_g2_i2:55-1164(+)
MNFSQINGNTIQLNDTFSKMSMINITSNEMKNNRTNVTINNVDLPINHEFIHSNSNVPSFRFGSTQKSNSSQSLKKGKSNEKVSIKETLFNKKMKEPRRKKKSSVSKNDFETTPKKQNNVNDIDTNIATKRYLTSLKRKRPETSQSFRRSNEFQPRYSSFDSNSSSSRENSSNFSKINSDVAELKSWLNEQLVELKARDTQPCPIRLNIFRELFAKVIEKAGEWAPLLTLIKNEYDSIYSMNSSTITQNSIDFDDFCEKSSTETENLNCEISKLNFKIRSLQQSIKTKDAQIKQLQSENTRYKTVETMENYHIESTNHFTSKQLLKETEISILDDNNDDDVHIDMDNSIDFDSQSFKEQYERISTIMNM